jgi:ActR/RegA family two-component response regulator
MAVVLVVEDDATVNHLLCRHLEVRGHTVLCATNAGQALTIGMRRRPDAAVLDLRLPDGDGLAIFGELKQQWPHLVGVMLTGFGSIANAVAGLQAGMSDYIEKPANLPSLVERIEALIDQPTRRDRASVGSAPAVRIAEAIARAIESPEAPRSLAEWGRAAGAARGTLRTWCRSVGVHAHDALCLTRGLWAIESAARLGGTPAEFLGYLDARSAREFMARSGLPRDSWQAVTPVQFCVQQQFCQHKVIIAELVRLLSRPTDRPV